MASFNIDDDVAARLRALAFQSGLASIEDFLRFVSNGQSVPLQPFANDAELDAALEPLLIDGPTLPADFSRADIYAEHD